MKKETTKQKDKRYRIESFSGTYYQPTLKEAVNFVLHYRKNPNWAFGNGGAKIFLEEVEVITTTKKGKCVKVILPDVRKIKSDARKR